LAEKCSNPTLTTKLDNRHLQLEILAANTTLVAASNFWTTLYVTTTEPGL